MVDPDFYNVRKSRKGKREVRIQCPKCNKMQTTKQMADKELIETSDDMLTDKGKRRKGILMQKR